MNYGAIIFVIFVVLFFSERRIDNNEYKAFQYYMMIRHIYTPKMEELRNTLRTYRGRHLVFKFLFPPPDIDWNKYDLTDRDLDIMGKDIRDLRQ